MSLGDPFLPLKSSQLVLSACDGSLHQQKEICSKLEKRPQTVGAIKNPGLCRVGPMRTEGRHSQSIGLLMETLRFRAIYPAGILFACNRLLADAPHTLRWSEDAPQTDPPLNVSTFSLSLQNTVLYIRSESSDALAPVRRKLSLWPA